MKRLLIPDLLDSDAGTPAEISASLSDLGRINQWFGGIATTESMLTGVAQQLGVTSLSILEVGAGRGDGARVIRARLGQRGIELEITLLDRAFSHLTNGARNGTPAVVGDALALPFADSSFDLVSSCLFTHHLTPEEVTGFADEGLRVCRTAVLINDLVRHPVHRVLAYAAFPLYRSRITRHDAPASVCQAYTSAEMQGMLAQTQAARVEIRRHYLFRMAAIAWKRGQHV